MFVRFKHFIFLLNNGLLAFLAYFLLHNFTFYFLSATTIFFFTVLFYLRLRVSASFLAAKQSYCAVVERCSERCSVSYGDLR